ncbi:MAG: DoxX family protein [Actinomycetia bacterium]|nr:DoxX family protein [Actinomycetes bacterium]
MSLVRRIARPMLAAIFIASGVEALRHPAKRVEHAQPLVDKAAEPLGLPEDPELLIRANGAVMVGAGALLATGRFPRFAATALAGTLVPTTMVEYPFWAAEDPAERRSQMVQALKNVGLLGGLLLAAVDTEGRPGLAYRAKMAGDNLSRSARHAKREARSAARLAGKEARLKVNQAANALS